MDNLETIKITEVYKDGLAVVKDGLLSIEVNNNIPFISEAIRKSVHFADLTESKFDIPLKGSEANIIEIIPNSLVTNHRIEQVETSDDGLFQASVRNDQLKLAVIERHHMTGFIGLGIVKGLGLKSGAIATTIAHDSHNLIIAGTNNPDMIMAAKTIKNMQGGMVVVNQGEVIASLELSIAGLMSDLLIWKCIRN